MTPRDIFGIILRTFGLALFLWGILYLYSPIGMLAYPEENDGSALGYLLYGGACILISLYFLRGAPHILRFAYSDKSNLPPAPSPASAPNPHLLPSPDQPRP